MPPSTRFLFVRHGQTIWNQGHRYAGSGEVPLSKESASEVAHITQCLKEVQVDAIYSSPLTRCIETITPIAKEHHRRIILREELRERNLGSWQGKAAEEIHPTHSGYHFPESAYNGDFRIPDAEPIEHLEHRVHTLLNELRDAHPDQTVVLATHAGVVWMVQNHIVSNPPRKVLWPGNCQLTTVVSESRHYVLENIQELADLPT